MINTGQRSNVADDSIYLWTFANYVIDPDVCLGGSALRALIDNGAATHVVLSISFNLLFALWLPLSATLHGIKSTRASFTTMKREPAAFPVSQYQKGGLSGVSWLAHWLTTCQSQAVSWWLCSLSFRATPCSLHSFSKCQDGERKNAQL